MSDERKISIPRTDTLTIDATDGKIADYVEIITDAGIVHIATNLVNTRKGHPVVMVQVEPLDAWYCVHISYSTDTRHDLRLEPRGHE